VSKFPHHLTITSWHYRVIELAQTAVITCTGMHSQMQMCGAGAGSSSDIKLKISIIYILYQRWLLKEWWLSH
jgi:hypothetical protein